MGTKNTKTKRKRINNDLKRHRKLKVEKPEPIKYRCRIANLPLECILYSEHSPLEYLLYSKPSSRILYNIVNIPPGENLLYSKHSPIHSRSSPPDILLYSKCFPLIRIITIDSEFSTLIVLICIVVYH